MSSPVATVVGTGASLDEMPLRPDSSTVPTVGTVVGKADGDASVEDSFSLSLETGTGDEASLCPLEISSTGACVVISGSLTSSSLGVEVTMGSELESACDVTCAGKVVAFDSSNELDDGVEVATGVSSTGLITT